MKKNNFVRKKTHFWSTLIVNKKGIFGNTRILKKDYFLIHFWEKEHRPPSCLQKVSAITEIRGVSKKDTVKLIAKLFKKGVGFFYTDVVKESLVELN